MDTFESLSPTPKLSDVDTWSEIWSVHDDPFPHIRCRKCEQGQSLQDSAKPFVHGATCKVIQVQGAFPWWDLMWIIGNAQGAQ